MPLCITTALSSSLFLPVLPRTQLAPILFLSLFSFLSAHVSVHFLNFLSRLSLDSISYTIRPENALLFQRVL